MEIYKDLSSPASQQFEKLLNNQLSKNKIEEGKIIEGKITKITEKYIFLFIQGLKSEPVIDINEMKMIGMQNKIAEGEKPAFINVDDGFWIDISFNSSVTLTRNKIYFLADMLNILKTKKFLWFLKNVPKYFFERKI